MARSFNGSTQRFEIADGTPLDKPDGAWAVSWYMDTADWTGTGGNPKYPFDNGAITSSPSFSFLFAAPDNQDDWRPSVYGNSGGSFDTVTSFRPAANICGQGWQHWCIRRAAGTPGTVTVWIDGVLRHTMSTGVSGAFTSPSNLIIGARADLDSARHFEGSMAEWCQFSGALTDAQIVELAGGTEPRDLSGTAPTIDWYFPMRETSGNCVDVIGGSLTMTAYNSPGNVTHPSVTETGSGITADLTVTLADIELSATATRTIPPRTGNLTVTLPAIALASTATSVPPGTSADLAVILGNIQLASTATASGLTSITGDLSATLAALQLTATADFSIPARTGNVVITLPAVITAATATYTGPPEDSTTTDVTGVATFQVAVPAGASSGDTFTLRFVDQDGNEDSHILTIP